MLLLPLDPLHLLLDGQSFAALRFGDLFLLLPLGLRKHLLGQQLCSRMRPSKSDFPVDMTTLPTKLLELLLILGLLCIAFALREGCPELNPSDANLWLYVVGPIP